MMGCRSRDSCRKLLTDLKILPQLSLYILCLLLFVIKNKELFTTDQRIHGEERCLRRPKELIRPGQRLKLMPRIE
jgi:hypothetical protein